MAKETTIRMWRRALILILMMAAGLCLVVFNLIRLQLVDGEELKKAAIDQSLQPTTLTAERGTIYDCSGTKILAQSASVWTVALEPAYINEEDKEVLARGLAEILDMEEADVLALAQKKTYFTYVKKKVETSVKDEILEFLEENNISRGVQLIEDYKRYYPYGNFMGPVLGFTGADNQGLSGLEYQYDTELSGTAGRLVTAKNAVGTDMPFQYEQKVEAQDGYDLVLTIDEGIQHFLEEALEEGIENFEVANGACAIAMNVKTGAILGLATKGDYDPNDPWTITDAEVVKEIEALPEDEQDAATSAALQKQWRNKAVSDTYYPGSVFKMCTGSMAMEEGIVSEETTFTCNHSYVVEGTGGQSINCWAYGHGTQTFVEGLCNSCNPFFVHLGESLGPNLFYKYFEAFGFTQKTGIDLPGEANTIYYTADRLNPMELATESFGQNFSITPIHMLAAACSIANGGYLIQPHVVDHMLDEDGNIVMTADTSYKRQVISSDTSERMIKILQTNATVGTAKNGYIAGYRICGKTGTSQKVVEDNLDPTKKHYIASYCGFAPADDPEVALLVYYDEPNPNINYYGSAVAGPTFVKCMEQILPYLGIERKYTEEELEKIDTTAPSVTGEKLEDAKKTVEDAGLTVKVKGDGDTVLEQIPAFGEAVPQGGTIVLYTDEESQEETVTVPDLTGMSLSAANQTAVDSGIQIRVTGAALTSSNPVSQTQDIAEGTKVRPGTVVTVAFIEVDQVA